MATTNKIIEKGAALRQIQELGGLIDNTILDRNSERSIVLTNSSPRIREVNDQDLFDNWDSQGPYFWTKHPDTVFF